MKEYTISIDGHGCEITIGRLSEEQVKFISDSDEQLVDILHEDELGGHWAACDNVYHHFNIGDSGVIRVTDTDNNTVLEIDIDDIYDGGEIMVETENKCFLQEEDFEYLLCCSREKGNFFIGQIELEEDFDPSKLKIFMHECVGLDNCFIYGDMVGLITYDGEEMDNLGGDTSGKSFEAKITF